jgi:biopolymer transport protein TolR
MIPRRSRRAMNQINVVPYIDVMLVLLVIFMVAAPLLTVGVPVDLPKTGAAQLNIEQKPISVTIDERGRLFLQEKETTIERLIPEIQAIAKDGLDESIFIRGAAQVNYGRVAEVLAALKAGGYAKTALINQPQERR